MFIFIAPTLLKQKSRSFCATYCDTCEDTSLLYGTAAAFIRATRWNDYDTGILVSIASLFPVMLLS